jgi:tetratricopeptide (TPR) repeat protein
MRHAAFIFALLIGASLALADIVTLKDGTRLEGDVKKTDGGWTVTTRDGKVITVTAAQVKSIAVGGSAGASSTTSPAEAMSGLLSLRRSVENVSDLKQIIERFKKFIDSHKDTPAALEAQKDLAMWQERLERGLVKHGTHWVTADERSKMADRAQELAEQARDLMQQGRVRDADPLVQQALDADPQCVPALYLRGVALYQQNKMPDARKMFDAINGLIADHAPTLNNLGVILWRQNAIMPALNYYDQAIVAQPVNKVLLDNVAEALAAVPDSDRKNPVAQKIFRHFTEQDTRLQEIMAAQGFYRWGSTWVDRPTMERYRDTERVVSEKITAAKAEFEFARRRVQDIDSQLAQIDESMRRMEAESWMRDPSTGRLIRIPLPSAYYDLQNEQSRLRSERKDVIAKGTTAQEQLKSLQAQLPKPKFTGVHQLIGPEGAPVMMAPPSSQPTTSPSSAASQPS